jgi:mRNA interferase RelE/StbE
MNKYKIEFDKTFNKSISKLDKTTRKQIEATIASFLNNSKNIDIIKLKGHQDFYRIRSGDYRIILERCDDVLIITFIEVKHRKEVYRDY